MMEEAQEVERKGEGRYRACLEKESYQQELERLDEEYFPVRVRGLSSPHQSVHHGSP